ncbi:hypothetical protein H9K75_06345 [Diaphorobacter aerolatus]|uniref:Uncharacterized protein n=1 Tax=Diaphorobacter aerolatus TaxID=1288495 RepID=A0A7H0GMS2_9BURK|nr:hypothetical protein H9K75_06345 [Diaphorobacter aerolatus]
MDRNSGANEPARQAEREILRACPQSQAIPCVQALTIRVIPVGLRRAIQDKFVA